MKTVCNPQGSGAESWQRRLGGMAVNPPRPPTGPGWGPAMALAGLWIALALLLALPVSAGAQFSWVTNRGAIVVTGYGGFGGAVSIPATIDGLPVTSIGDGAFYSNTIVTSVIIPNGVTNLGDSAFYGCENLAAAALPGTLVSIADSAFYACESLAGVTLPGTLTSIGASAFNDCVSLTNLAIPASVTSIGDAAFAYCDALEAITAAPGNPAYAAVGGVLFNKSETSLLQFPPNSIAVAYTVPPTVTSIGDSAFADASGLVSVTLGASVTSLGPSAFANCSSLASIPLPDGLLSLGDYAFLRCWALTNSALPATVTNLGAQVFSDCSVLAAIAVATNNPAFSSLDGVLFDKSQATLLVFPPNKAGPYTIPGTVASIADFAFAASIGLTNLAVPAGATNVGTGAFSDSNLETLTLPNTVLSLGDCVCSNCVFLTGITLPDRFPVLGDGAFYACYSLPGLTIPDSVTSIGANAFNQCPVLTNLTLSSNVTAIGAQAFADCALLAAINVDTNNPAYSSAAGVLFDKAQTTLIQYPAGRPAVLYAIPGTVTSVGAGAFYASLTLANVTVPNSVTSIGDEAFSNCTGLTNVSLGNHVSSIGDSAFESCTLLTTASLPSSLTALGDYAFAWDSQLTGLTVPAGVTSIGDFTFAGCAGFASVTLPDTVVSIGDSAFAGCAGLSTVGIPSSVTSIVQTAFQYCNGLAAINVDTNNPAYSSPGGVWLDKGQTALFLYPARKTGVAFALPATVTTIEDVAFFDCTNLTAITVPAGVTSMGAGVFYLCHNLAAAYFLGNAPAASGLYEFDLGGPATVYYLPGTSGWGPAYGGAPTVLWNPQMQGADPARLAGGGFNITITGTAGIPIALQASSSPAGPSWTTLLTGTLTNGSIQFNDPASATYPARFYRIAAP